jgi:predicted transglutaminase-like cysteine proteinase
MRQTIKRKSATIKTTTAKVATTVAALGVSCSLLYAMGDNLDYSHKVKTAAEQDAFGMPAAEPIAFLALSRELNLQTETASFDMSATAPLSGQFKVAVPPVSYDTPSATFVTFPKPAVRRPVDARQANSAAPSSARTAFYSVPRRLESNTIRIGFDTPSLAPMAFVRFCIQYPQDCTVRRMAFRPGRVVLSEARKAELATVNRDVNRAIRPQANDNGVMEEEWLVSPREGDCNDYAVTKRHELLARGWSSRSLLLAEVVIASGEHHLVLVVRTREDDFVLDNLNQNVRPVSQIRYQWVRAQQEKNPKFWSTINVTRGARVATNTR